MPWITSLPTRLLQATRLDLLLQDIRSKGRKLGSELWTTKKQLSVDML